MQPNQRAVTSRRVFCALAGVIAVRFQAIQVSLVNITGGVVTVKDRTFKVTDLAVALGGATQQVIQVLIQQPVCPDLLLDFFHAAVVGY